MSLTLVSPEIERYAEKFSDPENSVLKKLHQETYEKMQLPQMLSGHLQGRFLSFISKLLKLKFIVEVGTFTGYSAICLAEGLQKDGKLLTIDINASLKKNCERYFKLSGLERKIEMRIGNALEILPRIKQKIDLAFIDADKENYISYYETILARMRKGGVILADNVLWSGRVLDDSATDKETMGLKKFNEYIRKDKRVETILLPIRDGLMLIYKK